MYTTPAAKEDGAHEIIMMICGGSGVVDYFYPSAVFERGSDIPYIVPVSVCMCPLAACFLQGTLFLLVIGRYNIFPLTSQIC
jgi:hypothetical protein